MDSKNVKMIRLDQYKGIAGAVIGDVWGSHYEFLEGCPKAKPEEVMLYPDSRFTDDTVLTAAIADYLNRIYDGIPIIPEDMVLWWARQYPDAGFGGMFYRNWIYHNDLRPYNSYGNGSAMRISAVPYYASSIEECIDLSKKVTEITHNHPEGMKGAEVIAVATYMALHGSSKEEIEAYARQYYDLDLDYEEMMDYLNHGPEICQVTVPQALWIFLHSNSFEECLRLAISIRWDADTLAAIACTLAEAYYKEMPEWLYKTTMERVDNRIKHVLASVPKRF